MAEKWNAIELEILKNFREQGKTFEDISRFVNHNAQSCRVTYGKKFGTTTKSNQKLSDEERKFIEDNWKTMKDTEIAKILQRSKNTVTSYRISVGLFKQRSRVDCFDYTARELSEIVGVDRKTVLEWIVDYKLPNKYSNGSTCVNIDIFIGFLKEHKNLWDPKKCDKDFLWEYKWFQKAYKEAWDIERKRYQGELK